ncbi:MAG: hypothetical protein HKO53_15835, partial [Gemmatimonadetes bacterium]|nr:hypothetical protein [Gemmatimonadota bacterium]
MSASLRLTPVLALLFAVIGVAPAAAQSPDELEASLASMSWRNIGPVNMGGRVTAVAGIPGDRDVFWVGAADGGVWKTSN